MRNYTLLVSVLAVSACTDYIKIDKSTCAQICLNSTTGVCPTSIVVKTGGLHTGTCSARGFNEPNGTKVIKAGPCGTLTFDVFEMTSGDVTAALSKLSQVDSTLSVSDDIELASFDGQLKWEVVDDPVMGGQSKSFLDITDGHWYGKVAIVPFLKSPGFCTIRTDFNKFPNVTGTTEFKMYVRNKASSTLENFMVQLETRGGRSGAKQGTYNGNITVPATSKWVEVSRQWKDFSLNWRGEPISGPAMTSQLDQIMQLGVSTFFPGKAGSFDLEIQWMRASN